MKEKLKNTRRRLAMNRWIYSMNLRKARIEFTRRNKNKNYIMLNLHQFKLMTSNGFGILLILVERIKIDIAST